MVVRRGGARGTGAAGVDQGRLDGTVAATAADAARVGDPQGVVIRLRGVFGLVRALAVGQLLLLLLRGGL